MRVNIAKKAQLCQQYSESIAQAKSLAVFEYNNLNAKEITAVRRKLHDAGAKMLVLQNNILNRSLASLNIAELQGLVGKNAIIIANQDEVIPFKVISDLAKDKSYIKYKGGIIESKFVSENEYNALAAIPSREGLYGMLLNCLNFHVAALARGLQALAETKK